MLVEAEGFFVAGVFSKGNFNTSFRNTYGSRQSNLTVFAKEGGFHATFLNVN